MTVHSNWNTFIEAEKRLDYYQKLQQFVQGERNTGKAIFPPLEEVFTAFEKTPLD